MDKFLDWFNNENRLDPVLKAAIALFWFIITMRYYKKCNIVPATLQNGSNGFCFVSGMQCSLPKILLRKYC